MKSRLLLFVFALAAPTQLLPSAPQQGEGGREQPLVILLSLDGFRWDYLDRGFSPNLDRLRKSGSSAISLAPVFPTKTFPNHYSLVTGQYAGNHGILANRFLDPHTGRTYSLSDTAMVRDPSWYQGEAFWETAERQGVIAASYFWPGSELRPRHRRPTYVERYVHERPYGERIAGVLEWLQLPEQKRPHFITLYMHEVDSKGHRYGPDSPETNRAIALVDSMVGVLIAGLDKIGMRERANLIIVSDHGMTALDRARTIPLDNLLGSVDWPVRNEQAFLFLRPPAAKIDSVYAKLRARARNFRIYRPETLPETFHFSGHPAIPPLIAIADIGWAFVRTASGRLGGGQHGYESHEMDMHGIFIGAGPAFRRGFRTGTVRTIDVYPLICEIFGIMPSAKIDGKLSRIGFMLRSPDAVLMQN